MPAKQIEREQLIFETRDTGIFSIPDTRTRLDTLQNYFFPRMDRLLDETIALIADVYGVDARESMSPIHRPNHRKTRAASHFDVDQVYVGLAPRRQETELLTQRADGTPYHFGPSYLVAAVRSSGHMQASFWPYAFADQNFRRRFAREARAHWADLGPVLEHLQIRSTSDRWVTLDESLSERFIQWEGPSWHLPLATPGAIARLQAEFVALYALLDTTTRLARGAPSRLGTMLKAFMEWHAQPEPHVDEQLPEGDLEVDSLGSYPMLRSGRWWAVLARDKWTCVACGRSQRVHGVLLEADHILPRSKGGTDHLDNLQTLCRKCNSGKSNRDATDLRPTNRAGRNNTGRTRRTGSKPRA